MAFVKGVMCVTWLQYAQVVEAMGAAYGLAPPSLLGQMSAKNEESMWTSSTVRMSVVTPRS